jgi:endonuclease-8
VPEGDTVWLTAHRLNQALQARTVDRFELRIAELATIDLTGSVVTRAFAHGKHLLIRFDRGFTLHSHLRMDGAWHLSRPGARSGPLPDHMIRAIIGNGEWTATGYRIHDVRLVPAAEEADLTRHLGPDLLGPDWDPLEAVARLAAQPHRTVAEGLLDQRILAGIGNLYKSEILFIERVHPWSPIGDVADLTRIVTTAHRLLRLNRDHPEQSTTGSTVRGRQHWVYLRAGESCLRCRTPIAYALQGTAPRMRATYWCPTCQPAPGH